MNNWRFKLLVCVIAFVLCAAGVFLFITGGASLKSLAGILLIIWANNIGNIRQ